MTRDGTVSLEIEIPRTGVTSKAFSRMPISHCSDSLGVERWFMAFFLMIASVLVLIGIPLVPLQIVMNGCVHTTLLFSSLSVFRSIWSPVFDVVGCPDPVHCSSLIIHSIFGLYSHHSEDHKGQLSSNIEGHYLEIVLPDHVSSIALQ